MARRPPVTDAVPRCGRIRPASTLSSVVLPAPFGPKTASVWPGARVNETSSSATTRPPPSPNACRSPSARSIDARGEVFHVERLDEIPGVPEIEHVDEGLHAHVRRRHDDGERRVGRPNL